MTAASILVVEDYPYLRTVLADLLRHEGYTVATASNGAEALAYLKQHPPPRLILLDLRMPVMNGWTFLAHRRADPALAAIPVVVLSSDAAEVQAPLPPDVAAWVPKPIAIPQLLAIIAQVCQP